MKIIDAYWEEKNLGVTTAEIRIDNDDSIEEVVEAVEKVDKQYIVCKVISTRNDIAYKLQEKGFLFIEDQIELEHDLHEINRNGILQRLYDSLPYKAMDKEDLDYLYNEIRNGMFSTDRISMDPYFDKDMSARRYINWISDLVEKGAVSYLMSYKDEPAGFVLIQNIDGSTYRSVLGGGYEKFRKSGLGVVLKEMEMVRNSGGKRVLTSVSSNNANQLKVLIRNGYIPTKIEYVLIKHN
jgi:hypothetical protein